MIISGIRSIRDMNEIDVISMISLSRLRDGGAAMFDAVNKNHHRDMVGRIFKYPFIKNMLRVWEFS